MIEDRFDIESPIVAHCLDCDLTISVDTQPRLTTAMLDHTLDAHGPERLLWIMRGNEALAPFIERAQEHLNGTDEDRQWWADVQSAWRTAASLNEAGII